MLRRMLFNRKRTAENGPSLECFAEKNKTSNRNNNTALAGLQELREIAWEKAIKYRFDPVLGRAHDEYLQALNGLIMECTR